MSSRVSLASSGREVSAQVSPSVVPASDPATAESSEFPVLPDVQEFSELSEVRSMPKYQAAKTTTAPPIITGKDFLRRAGFSDEKSSDACAMRTIVAAMGCGNEIRWP